MKAAVYYTMQDIRLEEMLTPTVGEQEALVKMKACGICGSDLMDWYVKTRAPTVLGHEPSGTIVEVGNRVQNFDIEDRVFVHHHVACLTCHYCTQKDYTLCKQFHETNIDPGGLAQYFRVPEPNLRLDTLKIPKSISFEEATLIEPIGCCIRALRKNNIQADSTAAILGAGTTGVVFTLISKIFKVSKTIVSDPIEHRLKLAKSFGADETVNPEKEDLEPAVMACTDGIGVDLVVVTAPSISAYKAALRIARKGGKICLFAPTTPGSLLQVSPRELFFSEKAIVPSYSTSHVETREALQILESQVIQARKLITHRFSLMNTPQAFKTASEDKRSLKVVVMD